MTCDECGLSLIAYPCHCGYQPKALRVQGKWIVQSCAIAGCFTAIRSLIGEPVDLICQWCQAGESHATRGQGAVDVRFKEAR